MYTHNSFSIGNDSRTARPRCAPAGRPRPGGRAFAVRFVAFVFTAGLAGCSASGIEEGIPSYAYAANGQLVPPPPPPQIGGAATKHVSARTLKAIEKRKQKDTEALSKR